MVLVELGSIAAIDSHPFNTTIFSRLMPMKPGIDNNLLPFLFKLIFKSKQKNRRFDQYFVDVVRKR